MRKKIVVLQAFGSYANDLCNILGSLGLDSETVVLKDYKEVENHLACDYHQLFITGICREGASMEDTVSFVKGLKAKYTLLHCWLCSVSKSDDPVFEGCIHKYGGSWQLYEQLKICTDLFLKTHHPSLLKISLLERVLNFLHFD